MNRRRALTYLNCFCCSRTHSVDDLIEMNANPLQVCDQMVDFQDLILDVCFVKLNKKVPNYICLDCKESLVQFHVFKKNIKGYSDFPAHVQKCEALLKLEPLLADCEQLGELQPKKYRENVVMLAPPDFHMQYEAFEKTLPGSSLNGSLTKQETFEDDNLGLEQTMSEGGPEDVLLHLVDEESLKKRSATVKESPDQKILRAPITKISFTKAKRNSLPSETKRLNTNESITPKPKRQKVERLAKECFPQVDQKTKRNSSSSRWNTNESLTPQQKDWINKQALKGTTQDAEGTHWSCTQCSKGFCSSWVLRKHLRDVHVINPFKNEKVSPSDSQLELV